MGVPCDVGSLIASHRPSSAPVRARRRVFSGSAVAETSVLLEGMRRTLTESQVEEASKLLVGHWKSGRVVDAVPEHIRPLTRHDGYAVQAQLERGSSTVFGWKIAATSEAGQQHIGIDGPIAGRLLSETVFHDGASIPFGHNRMQVAEAEFAFRMAVDLPAQREPYTQRDVLGRVDALHLAIELPDSRFADFATVGAAQLIADNACAHQFVLGPAAPSLWRELDLSTHRVVGRVGTRLEREGLGANVLGDPRIALTWLVNELSSLGITLRGDAVVTTGTCVVPLEIQAGDTVSADFGVLGSVSCSLDA
jgi:2-keto-4-pentenoate hydratase